MDDRRQHPRFDLGAQIRVKRGTITYIMSVQNISLSGALIHFDDLKKYPWFRLDQTLEIDFFEWEELTNIRVTGRITRISDDEHKPTFGIEFVQMSGDALQALQELLSRVVAAASAEPAPLKSFRKPPPRKRR